MQQILLPISTTDGWGMQPTHALINIPNVFQERVEAAKIALLRNQANKIEFWWYTEAEFKDKEGNTVEVPGVDAATLVVYRDGDFQFVFPYKSGPWEISTDCMTLEDLKND